MSESVHVLSLGAAHSLGAAGMRRRPVRTGFAEHPALCERRRTLEVDGVQQRERDDLKQSMRKGRLGAK